MSTEITRITGTLPEKVEAFKQMAACASSMMFAGYDSASKVMAAAWTADALGVHPAAFMQGVHCMTFDGKTVLTPKWEFEAALLRSRLPGFDYEVVENSETACELVGWAEGINKQAIRYTIKDAQRQGIYKRVWTSSDKEMLWKSAFHRLAKRIGAHVLMGLPPMVGVDEEEAQELGADTAPAEASAAVVVEEPKEPEDYLAALSELLSDLYGKRASKDVRLRACGLAMTELLREKLPTADAITFKRADQIGPVDAKNIYTFLLRKYPDRKLAPAGERLDAAPKDESPKEEEGAPAVQQESHAEVVEEPEPPAREPADETPPMEEPPDSAPELEDNPDSQERRKELLAAFNLLVAEARKKLKVNGKVVAVTATNAKGLWVNSAALVKSCGWPAEAVLLQDAAGNVVVPRESLELLADKLREMLR